MIQSIPWFCLNTLRFIHLLYHNILILLVSLRRYYSGVPYITLLLVSWLCPFLSFLLTLGHVVPKITCAALFSFYNNFPLSHRVLKSVSKALASPPTSCWIYAVEIILSVSKCPILFSPKPVPLFYFRFTLMASSSSPSPPVHRLSSPIKSALYSHTAMLVSTLFLSQQPANWSSCLHILPRNHLSHPCLIKLPEVDYII